MEIDQLNLTYGSVNVATLIRRVLDPLRVLTNKKKVDLLCTIHPTVPVCIQSCILWRFYHRLT
jgi:hypothetical protein